MARTRSKQSNHSPVGWYVATYVHRFVVLDEDNEDMSRRYTTWKNTILVKAESPNEAYRKAIKVGKLGCKPYENMNGQKVRFVYEGLSSLVPIYEELADGSEIFWSSQVSQLRTIRKMVKSKGELEAFEREVDV
ncbi:DUF4288 domain-containing protein [Paucibacter sp. R3-3]|uniref:DUF4288 domain-containing protein n=1 Tax=Roseateles agri TaxID=3098619 RepID=A0ABU5DJB8_9BURK|nr:DUF4288 domain-containing protein [Paucibacter sp. R3-3]MDY0746372.1 DUF4288 domain-containing protein [Paucibacter sp. R3-3]